MVHITEEASAVLDGLRGKALARIQRLPDGIPDPGLRLVIVDDQPSLSIDVPHAGDQIIKRGGHPVLLIDPDVREKIDGATVGIEHAPTGDRLVIGRAQPSGGGAKAGSRAA